MMVIRRRRKRVLPPPPPPSSLLPVAICTRSELEDFLSEAVCMKEFDHPNVMRLIGEGGADLVAPCRLHQREEPSLRHWEDQTPRLPPPPPPRMSRLPPSSLPQLGM